MRNAGQFTKSCKAVEKCIVGAGVFKNVVCHPTDLDVLHSVLLCAWVSDNDGCTTTHYYEYNSHPKLPKRE